MLNTLTQLPFMVIDINHWLNLLQEYRPWLILGVIVLLVLIILRGIWRRVSRMLRRLRPARIHPSLQKYNVDYTKQTREQKERAVVIVATSMGNRLAGYRIVKQVDAVFVEGYRTPEEAMVALKATAAERGANALLNVRTDRTSAGKCTASGDAVVADAIRPRSDKNSRSVEPPKSG
ncbi:MAG: hypothetical protein ACYTF1_14265 [Planctomycetota bacterium]|jgi:uncharacterized protein YbjQ (UPF0145 family)